MHVDVKSDSKEALDAALKEFKRKVKKENILGDLRRHEAYIKPSQKRKLKHIDALKQRRRDERENNEAKRAKKTDTDGNKQSAQR